METLVQRLVANPHDEEALTYAHRAGQQNPKSYALLLEKVGTATADPAIAAHWLSEAANVWSMTLGDPGQAARMLTIALERDPTQRTTADRLTQIFRDTGDMKALLSHLERLAKGLAPLMYDRPDVRAQLIATHEELARLFAEPPLLRPDRAVESWKRVVELDPRHAYGIYSVRELLKTHQQYAEAIPYFAMEQALVEDPPRKLALYRDEADIRRRARDLPGATQALRGALSVQSDDATLMQELALLIVERISGGEPVSPAEREEAARLFVTLAEMFDGDYGLSYSRSALQILPGNDRAMQLADHYGKQLNRTAELTPLYTAYLKANPNGFMANEARAKADPGLGARPMPPPPMAMQPPMPGPMPGQMGGPMPGQMPGQMGPMPGQMGPMPGQMPGQMGPMPGQMPGQMGPMPGQMGPMPGQMGPMPGQMGPMPGQMPGQMGPMPGQMGPMPGQMGGPMPGQMGPMPGQPPMQMPGQPPMQMPGQGPASGPEGQGRPAAQSQLPAPPGSGPAPGPTATAQPGLAETLPQLLEEAMGESQKGRKPQALAKYREALKIDPANSEALSWVEEHLRQKRMYADLRDVLLAASRVATVSLDTRKAQLRDVAALCESQLRDIETAIQAWKQICQIDRGDEQAREQLRRLLERGAKWDDLATLLEQEAMGAPDTEQKIALEKKLATLHEQKRKDLVAAAEAWGRIASLSSEDDAAIQTAVKLFEKGERLDLAAQVITDNIPSVQDKVQRSTLLQKLGELRTKLNDPGAAGDAYAEAAEAAGQAKVWELAEKAYASASRWTDAANAMEQRAELADGKQKAALYAQVSEVLLKAEDVPGAITKLEQASEIDPANETYAQSLGEHYRRADRQSDLVTYLLNRAEKLGDKAKRIASRRTAAEVQRTLGDREGARESLMLLLQDGDDAEALGLLVEDATERGDHQESVELLRRLGALAKTPAEKLALALREANLLAESLDDVEGAIERYEAIVKTLDPKNRSALRAIADLEEKRANPQGAADALEREALLAEGPDRVDIAQRLAKLYEGPIGNDRGAIKALELIHAADPEDFDAISRLQVLCEQVEDWPRVATLMTTLIEVEGDEEEASNMTRRLADILDHKLGKGDEALAALERLADQGDDPCREAYVALGDRLGWKGIVATKLVAWNESGMGPARNDALRGAFERFLEIGREPDALRVAMELSRSRGMDRALAERAEAIAAKLRDLEALGVTHDILAKDLSGAARAAEFVRQAEVKVAAGVDPAEAIPHGESALASVPAGEVEALLTRLSALAKVQAQVIDIYERQVSRCRAPGDRLTALARAAQVAAQQGANDRARSFFELALSGGVQEDTIAALEAAARAGDERSGSTSLRVILAEALAGGGQGSRDGGRTRGALLRRAATIAYTDLHDAERAIKWLGDAIIAHVDDTTMQALEDLGQRMGDMSRVEATLTRALEEVFDGPLVRKLLGRRAKLRRDVIGDRKGAAVDLKKLHDLSPADQDVMNDLSAMLTELGDHRGMIQLYEDQILRGRDPSQRAELARKVAKVWEEDIGDAREAGDAWRRVLRMKAGDADATAGLERAKSGKLRRAPPPPRPASVPAPAGAVPPVAVAPLPPVPALAPVPAHEAATDEDSQPTADHAPPGLESGPAYPAPVAAPAYAQGQDYAQAASAYPDAAGGYAQQPGAEYGQAGGYAQQPGGYAQQPGAEYGQAGGYAQQPGHPYGQAGGYAQQPGAEYSQAGGYAQQPSGEYGQAGGYAQQPSGEYGQASGYAQQPGGYAQQPGGYAQPGAEYGQPPAYVQPPQAAYGEPGAYPQPPPLVTQPGSGYPPPQHYPQQPAYPTPPQDQGQAAHEHSIEHTFDGNDAEILDEETGPQQRPKS